MRWNLPPESLPAAWFNVAPHLPEPLAAPAAPGHPAAGRARRPGPAVPHGAHRPGGVDRALDRHARRGPRRPPAVAPHAARPGRAARAGAGHAGPHLLQGRVGVAGRVPQAQHRRAPGLLQQGRRGSPASPPRPAPASGAAPCRFASRPLRPGVQGLHGAGVLRPEALPADDDGDLGRPGRRLAGRRARPPRLPRRRDQRRRPRCASAATTPTTPSGSVLNHVLLHQTVIGLEAKEQLALAGEERPDIVIGCCGGGSNLGGICAPVRARRRCRPPRRRAVLVPDAHRGRVRVRLRRHGRHDAPPAHVHLGPRVRPAGHPRRRPALPRRRPDHLQPGEGRADAGDRLPPGQGVRGGRAVRPDPGHHPGARDGARHPGRHRRGAGGQGDAERSGSSCSTTPATGSSTSAPTTTT